MQNKKKFSLVLCLVALLVVGTLCLAACSKKDTRGSVTFQGVEEIHAPVGTVTEESLLAGVKAVDANGKSKKVTVDLGDADLSKPGRHVVEYKAGGNVKREAVYLYGDISFQMNGQNLVGDKLEIPFATAINSLHFAKLASATDSFGNEITAKLVEGDQFDYAVGEYTAKYTATDKAGQTAEKTVTFVVTSDVEMTVQSGVSVKYEQESVTFKIDLDGEKDVWLMANGGLVSIADYTVTEKGLELKASYYRTLLPGENTLKICSVNGSTEFSFTVVDTGKPIFTFDSLYKTYIITGDAAVYEMPQAQIAIHEYSYSFKVTKDGVTYKAQELGDSVLFATSSGKNLAPGIYEVTVTATNKADTSKKTTITRDFRIYTNQTEIDGWEFWNAPQAATMLNVDLSDMGYFRTSWKYDAKSTAAWDSRVQWMKAKPKTFQSITFDFYVYSLGIAEKENGPVKYVGKNGKADILFNALTMGGESLAFMFYDQNGNVVSQDELKMNTWYTMKLDVSEFSGGETDIFMVSSLNNVRKVGMYITEMHFWAYEGSGAQNIFRDDAKTATIQRNSGKSNFVSATLDDETVWMYSVTEKHMPSTALKRSLKVNTSKTKEVISIDFKFVEDPKDAWGNVLKPTMFVHDLDYPQKDIAYGANYTLVDAETGKPVETPEVGKWYTLYITTKGRENYLIYPMGETKDPVTCKVAFKNLQTYDVDLGNAQMRTDLGNVSRVSLFKNAEGKWQYSYVSYTGWSKTYPNDAWRRRAVVSTTGDVSKVTFQFKYELSEYLEAGKEEFVDNFTLLASVEAADQPALVTTIYDENGNVAGETDIQIGKWYYAVVTREDGKDIVNPFCLLVGGSLSGGDGNIVNIEMELRDLQGVAPSADEFTVDFDLNYDSAPDYNETLTVAPYTTYGELPVPEQREDGQYFNGWFKDAACTEAVVDSMLVTESHTLYAKWGDRPLLNVTFTYPDYGTYYAEVFTTKQGTDTIHKYASTMPNDAGRWHEGVYAEYRRVTMNIADELGDTIVMDVMIESVTDVDGNALDTSTLTIYPAGSNAPRSITYTDAEGNPVDGDALVVGQWYTATFTGVGAQSYDIYPFALGEAGGGQKGIFYMKNIKLIPGEAPEVPDDDFNPTLRFALTSDTHLFNRYQGSDPQEARLENVFKVSYRYAQQSTYNKLDAVLVAGDISEGDAGEFVMFKDIVDANIQEGTQLIVGMGNHDFRGGLEPAAWTEDAAKKLEAAFKETFGLESADQHVVIGGYHFISLSPNAENLGNNVGESYSQTKLAWLEAEIQKAIAEDATKPVFVMQHHHPSGTVYGSGAAGGKQADLFNLLSKYPQVVDFSGHSHYPVNDPRNVWQGAFTAIGTGTLFYVGLDINGGPSGVSPDGYQGDYSTSGAKNDADYGVFQIIEVNADNDIRVIVYDLRSFEELCRFVIPNPVENKDFKIEQAVPEFAEDTDIYYEDGYIYVQQAVSEDIIESYRAEVYEGDKFIGTYYGLSGYVYPKQLQPEYVRIHVGELAENKGYTVKVYAVNVYNELSEALVFVTAEPDTKVIFDLDYEGAPAPEEVMLIGGKAFGKLPRPDRAEYAFGGWFTEKNGAGEQITADTIVEGECTLYAYWFVPDTPKPTMDATLSTFNGFSSSGVTIQQPVLEYIDGAWVYVYNGSDQSYSDAQRYLRINIGDSVQENKVTMKIKMTNVDGVNPIFTACGDLNVKILNANGQVVVESITNGEQASLSADEWYTFIFTTPDGASLASGGWWHLGGHGIGNGYADIHIKDITFETFDVGGLTFEVTFNQNYEGAADPTVITVSGGTTLGDKLPVPVREGYKFNGWSTSIYGWGLGQAFTADTAVGGSQTVYAMWTIDPEVFGYTFSYPNAEGTYYLDIAVTKLDNETVIKYSTTGNNHSGVTAYYRRAMLHIDNVAGQEIVVKMMAPAGASSAQTKLAVHNAAGTALDITITNADGEKVDALVAGQWCTVTFTSDGSDNYQIRPFDGGGTSGTLYIKDAKAEEIPVNEVKLDLNYEGAEAPATINVVAGNAYGKLPTPRRTDYAFGGWYKTADCTGEAVKATDIVSADHTLYAKWFVPTEPKPTMDATLTTYTGFTSEGTIHQPTLEYIDGEWVYVYVGSDTAYSAAQRYLRIDVGASVQESKMSMKIKMTNVGDTDTIYVPCGSLSVEIYDLNGNAVAVDKLQADVWYTFVHTSGGILAGDWWHLGGFGSGTGTMDIYIKDIVFGEPEVEEPTTYDVTFNLNYEGAGEGPAKITREEGAAYGTLPTDPTREGYIFGGWFLTEACDGEAIEATDTVSASHTLYAKWVVPTEPKPIMDATIDGYQWDNGPVPVGAATLQYIDGEWVYEIVASDKEYTEAQRFLKINVGASVQESKMTMKIKMVNVSGANTVYTPNGSLAVEIYDLEGNPVAAEDLQADVWYTFVHTKGSGVLANDWWHLGGFGSGTGTMDIYIKDVVFGEPAAETFDVTFDLNYEGAGEGPEAITRAEGAAYGTLPTPTRKYHTFDGWYTDAEHTNAVDVNAGVTADTTLYAKWTFDPAAAGFEFVYATGIGEYYGNVTAVEVDGDVAFKHYIKPHTDPTTGEHRRVHLKITNGEKQIMSMKVKITECSGTPALVIYNQYAAGMNVEVGQVFTDENGNIVDGNNLELNKWYTVTWITDASAYYQIRPFDGSAVNGTYYMKDITIKDLEGPLASTYYAWVAPFAMGDQTAYMCYARPTGNPTDYTHRRVDLSSDVASGETISVQVMIGATTGTPLFAIQNASGAAITSVVTDADGNTVDSTAMELNQWYTLSWTSDGSASYRILSFDGTAVNGTYFIKGIISDEPVVETFDVTFDLNYEGAGEGPEAITRAEGAAYGTLPEAEREGYTFEGWFLTEACDGEAIEATDTVSTSHTLYAKWAIDKSGIDYYFTYGLDVGTYYANVTETVLEGEFAYKCVVDSHGEGTNAVLRRVHLNVANAEKQAIRMQVYFAECTNTPSIKLWRGDGTVANAAYAVYYIVTDAEGNVYDPHNLELNKWYTVTWLAAGVSDYMVMPFEGEATNGTYYVKDLTVTTVEDPLSANFYAWPAPFAAGDETHYWVHVRAPYDAQINDRYVVLKSDAAAGDTISFKMKATEINNNGTSDLIIKNASGTAMTISIVDENGNSVNATEMQLNQWYTVSWVADGSASYNIHAFAGVKVDGNYFIKDITFGKAVATFDVTFDLNYEGAENNIEKITVEEGATYGTLPTPTRKGYAFGGWFLDSACGGEPEDEDAVVCASHTLYAKWVVPTEPKPTMDATIDGFQWAGGPVPVGAATLQYIDGEWVYEIVASDKEYTEAQRYLKINVGASVQESKMTMKIKMVNVSGANTVYTPNGSLTVEIYDLEGNPVAAADLQADVWYTFVHTKGSGVLANDWWHLGGFGSGTGTMDIYIKDIVFA